MWTWTNDNPGEDFVEAVETYVESLMYGLQCNVASSAMMTRIKQAYKEDPVCAQVMAYCEHGCMYVYVCIYLFIRHGYLQKLYIDNENNDIFG